MTVAELIALLQQLPQEHKVFAESYDQFCEEVIAAHPVELRRSEDGEVVIIRTSDDLPEFLYA